MHHNGYAYNTVILLQLHVLLCMLCRRDGLIRPGCETRCSVNPHNYHLSGCLQVHPCRQPIQTLQPVPHSNAAPQTVKNMHAFGHNLNSTHSKAAASGFNQCIPGGHWANLASSKKVRQHCPSSPKPTATTPAAQTAGTALRLAHNASSRGLGGCVGKRSVDCISMTLSIVIFYKAHGTL
jgi:hypothetical protein